jgi:hypothetical protein
MGFETLIDAINDKVSNIEQVLQNHESNLEDITLAEWDTLAAYEGTDSDGFKTSLLTLALDYNCPNILKILLEHGAVITKKMLVDAILNEDLERFKLLGNACIQQGTSIILFYSLKQDLEDISSEFNQYIDSMLPEEVLKGESPARYLLRTGQYEQIKKAYLNGFISELIELEPNSNTMETLIQKIWDQYIINDKSPVLLELITILADKTTRLLNLKFSEQVSKNYQVYNPNISKDAIKATLIQMRAESYYKLYNEELPPGNIHDKNTCLKIIFADFDTLMNNTAMAVHFLLDFEKLLQQNWQEEFERFPVQDIINFAIKWEEHFNMKWPIPLGDEHPSFSTNSFLNRMCFKLMKDKKYAEKMWVAFDLLSEEDFLKIIADFDYLIEQSLNPNYLIHGKNIHNVGRILTLNVWEQNMLDTAYFENDSIHHLSFKDFCVALTNKELTTVLNQIPWQALFDRRAPFEITFSDPLQMNAMLMYNYKGVVPYLSTLLTYSFCKSIDRTCNFFNESTNLNWSVDQVCSHYIFPRTPESISNIRAAFVPWLIEHNKISVDAPITSEKPYLISYEFPVKKQKESVEGVANTTKKGFNPQKGK